MLPIFLHETLNTFTAFAKNVLGFIEYENVLPNVLSICIQSNSLNASLIYHSLNSFRLFKCTLNFKDI